MEWTRKMIIVPEGSMSPRPVATAATTTATKTVEEKSLETPIFLASTPKCTACKNV